MYRIKEVSRILGFSERTIRQWINDGKIQAVKIISEWRVPREEIERLMMEGRNERSEKNKGKS